MIFRIITRNKACRSLYGHVPMTTSIILGKAKQRDETQHTTSESKDLPQIEKGEKRGRR